MTEVKKKKISLFITLFAVYLFCTPLDFLPIVPGFSIAKILVLLPLFGAIFELKKFASFDKKAVPAVLYFLMVSASLVYSIAPHRSIDRFISVTLNTVLILFVSLRKYRKDEYEYLIKAYVGSGWFLLALIFVYADYSTMAGRLTILVNGQNQDPNYLTGFFTFTICYYLWHFIQQRKRLYIIFVIIFFIPIFLTGSRGGLIGNGIAVFFVLFFCRKKINLTNIILIALAVVLLIALIWRFLPDYITQRYTLEYTQGDGGANRFDIWASCMYYFKRGSFLRKLLGHGAWTIPLLNEQKNVAHNLVIEFMLEYGIIGMFLIYGMYLYYIVRAKKLNQIGLISAFIGYMAMTMSLSLYSYKPIWNVIMLIILAGRVVSDVAKESKKEEETLCRNIRTRF